MPQLYATAGARFAFDAAPLRDAVTLIEQTIEEMETCELNRSSDSTN